MNTFSPIRIAAALLLAVAAYSLGRLHQSSPQEENSPPVDQTGEVSDPGKPAEPAAPLTRQELVLQGVAEVAEAARTMSVPDAHTYAFFENLDLDDLLVAVEFIEQMPPGNEQDVLFLMAMRQWAKLDGPGAVNRASTFPMLGTRSNARTAAYNVWAEQDSEAALLRAVDESEPDQMIAAIAAVIAGAATIDPKVALDLWNLAPKRFLDSPAGHGSLEQLVESAFGTGHRDEVKRLIEGLPASDAKTLMANALAANWAHHYPDQAYKWLINTLPPGEEQDAVVENMFTSMAFKDPSMAAKWAARNPQLKKQAVYIAAAVGQWAGIDVAGVEIWLNEQEGGDYLDGASFALAKHYLEHGQMEDSFAWIRRMREDRDRAELLFRLGRAWSEEEPLEFKRFLEESSLSPTEIEILKSGANPENRS